MIENNLEMRLTQVEAELAELKTMYRLSLNSLETSTKVVDLLLQRANATDEAIAELKAQKAQVNAPFIPIESSAPITNDAQLEQRRQQMEAQLEQRRQQMEAQLEQRRQQAEAQTQQQRQQMEAQFERQRHELERLAQRARA